MKKILKLVQTVILPWFSIIFFLTSFIPKKNDPFIYNGTKFLSTVAVHNIQDLYDAVDNVDNHDALLLLDAKSFVLDKSMGKNQGRLEFQNNMGMKGGIMKSKKGPVIRTTIDGSKIPGTSLMPGTPPRTGFIRMGNGTNTLSSLVVLGNKDLGDAVLSAIDTDLPFDRPVINIDHVTVMNCQTGIDIRNVGPATPDPNPSPGPGCIPKRILTANLTDNVLTSNHAGNGQGLVIQNSNGAYCDEISVTMSNNNINDNNIGMRVMNQASENAWIKVTSSSDHYNNNVGSGILIFGGVNLTGSTVGCHTKFTGFGIEVSGNYPNGKVREKQVIKLGQKYFFGSTGIYVAGGFSGNIMTVSSRNTADVLLCSPIFNDNGYLDVQANGAFLNAEGTGPAGTYNTASVVIWGIAAAKTDGSNASIPDDPLNTNTVTVSLDHNSVHWVCRPQN